MQDIETMQAVDTSIMCLKRTASDLQALSASMHNVGDDIGAALNCRYTCVLQDSVTRICQNLEHHATDIQSVDNNVYKNT